MVLFHRFLVRNRVVVYTITENCQLQREILSFGDFLYTSKDFFGKAVLTWKIICVQPSLKFILGDVNVGLEVGATFSVSTVRT